MADIKISELAEATSLNDSDVLAGVNAAVTRKFSLSRLKSFFFSALTKNDVGLGNVANVLQYSADNKPSPSEIGAVPETRKVNGKALAQNVTLDAADVGAYVKPSGGIPASDLASGVIPTVPPISIATPQMDGVGAAGSTGEVSDAGHTHPSDTSKANETELAYVETGSTASRAYAVGEYFCWNGLLYRAKTAISSGGTFTPETNCEQVTVGSILTGISVSTSAIGMPGIAGSNVRAGIVFLNIYDFKPSSASGTITGTLPQELRPLLTTSGMVLSADGTKFARISISTQGVVTYTGVDTSKYHYGLISYLAAI